MTQEEMRLEMRKDLEAMSKSRERLRECEKEIARGNWTPYRKLLLEQYEDMLEGGFYKAAFVRLVKAVYIAVCIEAVKSCFIDEKFDGLTTGTYAETIAECMAPEEIVQDFARLRDALGMPDEILVSCIAQMTERDMSPRAMDSEFMAHWIYHLLRGEADKAEDVINCKQVDLCLSGGDTHDHLQAATRWIRRGHVRSGRI